LRQPAVLTAAVCSLPDELARGSIHQEAVCLRKHSRALACKMVTK
jgi:hypothetical protein